MTSLRMAPQDWRHFSQFISNLYFISKKKLLGEKTRTSLIDEFKGLNNSPRVFSFALHWWFYNRVHSRRETRIGLSAISNRRLISLPSRTRVRQIVFHNPKCDREYTKWRACVRACVRNTRVSSIMDRIKRANATVVTLWRRERTKQREKNSSLVEIEIDTAQITNPRRWDKFLVRCSLNKIKIILVALKFFVAWGRQADNYILYLHISRDHPSLRVLLDFNTRRALPSRAGSASEFVSADNKEHTFLSRERERAR